MTEQIHDTVRRHYAQAALRVLEPESCCGDDGEYGGELYTALERDELPDAAVLASLGCGNPVAVAELREGERVLDLGSGGGIDVLLSARRVGPTGRAFGLDMTDEMLALAQRNAATAGVTNVEWIRGTIESIPLPASTALRWARASISSVMSSPNARPAGPTRRADRRTSMPPPEPRSSTRSPSWSSATATGLPQPSEAITAASGSSARSITE